jgi:O-antigen ligase
LFWGTAIVLASILVFGVFPERFFNVDNLQSRTVLWSLSWELFLQNPIRGIGFDNFRYLPASVKWGLAKGPTHSLYTSLSVELGLVGAGAFFWWLWAWVRILVSSTFAETQRLNRPARGFLLAVLSSYLLASFGHYTLTGFQATALWFTLLSVGMHCPRVLSEVAERVDLRKTFAASGRVRK